MRVALYYPWIYLKGGIERSILELVNRSGHEWTLFTNNFQPENTFEGFSEFDVRVLKQTTVNRDMGSVLSAASSIALQKLPLEGFDVLLVWCDGLGPLVTFRNLEVPIVCVCSTPLRPVYDPVYAKLACQGRKPLAKIAFHSLKHMFRIVDRLAWTNFDLVVSTSREVTERITRNRLYPDNEKLWLAHPGIDSSQVDSSQQFRYDPYFLVPGRISWTKNIELAIKAFLIADLPEPWKLVIAGFLAGKSAAYYEGLQNLTKGHPRIEYVISPSDAKLNALYENAYSILFPPLNEDWGMTPLEGMLRAKPIMAVASGGPLESVTDGKTGWLLSPEPTEWADLLQSIVEQPEEVARMGSQARQYVERFDWSNFVAIVDRAVRKLNPVRVPTVQPALYPK